MGASFGAYHAANTLFKHPDVVRRCFALSGVYDIKDSWTACTTTTLTLIIRWIIFRICPIRTSLGQLANCDIHIATGSGPWEHSGPSYRLSAFLRARGFDIHLDDWGPEGGHDWPYGNTRCGNTLTTYSNFRVRLVPKRSSSTRPLSDHLLICQSIRCSGGPAHLHASANSMRACVWLPYGSPNARCTPGSFSSCSSTPIMSDRLRFVPNASSPTRSLFSSVWQYFQNSASRSLRAQAAFSEATGLESPVPAASSAGRHTCRRNGHRQCRRKRTCHPPSPAW